MGFGHKYNKNDIFNRSIIAGVVNYLNNKVFFVNDLDDDKIDVIQVPFYFRFNGDERFIQDKFMNWNDCKSPAFADGNYERIPRGTVVLDSMSVDSSALTNRFIRGVYTKEVNGRIETFSANINPIPYKFSFNIGILADTFTDISKIQQSLTEAFFRYNVFNVMFKGFMLSCSFSWPEEGGASFETEFTFPSDDMQNYKLELSIEVDTYYPIVDAPGIVPETIGYSANIGDDVKYAEKLVDSNDIRAGERNFEDAQSNLRPKELSTELHNKTGRMQAIVTGSYLDEPNPSIKIISPSENDSFSFGSYIPIVWETTGGIQNIDILKSYDNGETWKPVVIGIHNIGQFAWEVPNDGHEVFVNGSGSGAILSASADAFGSIYQVNIINGGVNYKEDTTLSIITREGNGFVAVPFIENGVITHVEIQKYGTDYLPTEENEIKIKVRNSYNHEVSDVIERILLS